MLCKNLQDDIVTILMTSIRARLLCSKEERRKSASNLFPRNAKARTGKKELTLYPFTDSPVPSLEFAVRPGVARESLPFDIQSPSAEEASS